MCAKFTTHVISLGWSDNLWSFMVDILSFPGKQCSKPLVTFHELLVGSKGSLFWFLIWVSIIPYLITYIIEQVFVGHHSSFFERPEILQTQTSRTIRKEKKNFRTYHISGQIIIFHQPRFPWNKVISLTKPPFGVRSCEVAIIWPDIYMLVSRLDPSNREFYQPSVIFVEDSGYAFAPESSWENTNHFSLARSPIYHRVFVVSITSWWFQRFQPNSKHINHFLFNHSPKIRGEHHHLI